VGLTGSYYLGGMGLPRLIFIVCKLVGATMFQVLLLMMDFFDYTLSQMVKWNMDTHKIGMLLSYHIFPPSRNFRRLWATNNTLVPGPV
jgi:L-rhamnose isomerase